jgi:hypothetical protein
MTELYKVEKERLQLNAPISHAELSQQFDADILNRFQAVHELFQKNGKTREKYMQRLDLEFKDQGLKKSDLELIDSFFEHKRWVKQKQRAMLRELQRDRHNLKEKSIAMIEAQVEE